MTWISVKDRLPVIPEGRHGVSVLVATFDRTLSRWSVESVVYGTTDKHEWFNGCGKKFDFMTMYYGGGDGEWGPVGDEVLYWMPLPDPPKVTP